MTERQAIKGNILIAKFEGAEFRDDDKVYYPDGYFLGIGSNGRLAPDDLSYDRSFDDMMKIVEKFEKQNYGFKMCRKVVEVYFDDTKEVILKVKESSRKESLFKAIVEFIKWHQQNHKE